MSTGWKHFLTCLLNHELMISVALAFSSQCEHIAWLEISQNVSEKYCLNKKQECLKKISMNEKKPFVFNAYFEGMYCISFSACDMIKLCKWFCKQARVMMWDLVKCVNSLRMTHSTATTFTQHLYYWPCYRHFWVLFSPEN